MTYENILFCDNKYLWSFYLYMDNVCICIRCHILSYIFSSHPIWPFRPNYISSLIFVNISADFPESTLINNDDRINVIEIKNGFNVFERI